MAIIFDGPVTPADGTVFVRNIPTPSNLLLNRLLPDRFSNALEVDLTTITRRGNTARFRSYDAPAHITPRDQLSLSRVPLIPLSASKPVVGEQELARLYGLHQGGSPLAAQADSIYDDLANSTLDVLRRAEQARGVVLSTGTLPLNEGGWNGVIDMDVPAGNKLTAPTLFSATGAGGTTAADIIGFFNTVRNAYIALNGQAPGGFVTSTPVLTLMQQNRNLQSMVAQNFGPSLTGGYAGLLPQNALNALLGSYNVPQLQFLYDSKVDVDGTATLVIPNNVILVLPPDGTELGYTQWGPTVTAQKLDNEGQLHQEAPGLVGFVDRNDSFPYKEQSIVDSLAMPVITNGNGLMVLTVA